MTTHLIRRGARYSIRRRIPSDLVAFYGKVEIQRALGTSDRREAERLVRAVGAELDAEFDAARATIKAKRGALPASLDNEEATQSNAAPAPQPWTGYADTLEELEYEEESGRQQLQEAYAEEDADEQAEKLLQAFRRAGVTLPHFQPEKDAPAGAGTHSRGLGLSALADQWAEERRPDKRTISIMRRVVRAFEELVSATPVAKIEPRHVVAFKDALLKAGQTPVNTNKYLTNLSTLLNFAALNLLAPANPARGVKVQVSRRAKEKRRPWTAVELNQLFAGPVHAAGERPRAGAGDAAYWLPLLGLFTGARLEELAQLRPEDVREVGYQDAAGAQCSAWVLNIADRGEGQEVKTASSRRSVPVHAELIRLGFVNFAQAAHEASQSRLFHELRPDTMGAESGNWSKWFGKYKRAQGITDAAVVFHSLRHTWKALAREAGIPEDVSDAITGHTNGSVGRTYGGAYPLRPLVEAMGRYRVAGVSLP